MDASNFPWVLQQITTVAFVGIAGWGMAWRDDNPEIVAASGGVIRDALRVSGISQKEAAIEMDMDEGTFSRRIEEGGAFFARLMKLGIRRPVFGAALHSRSGELLRGASESPEERLERLLRDLEQRLPQKEPVKCEQLTRHRDSSAA
jgi:hypothetical protein